MRRLEARTGPSHRLYGHTVSSPTAHPLASGTATLSIRPSRSAWHCRRSTDHRDPDPRAGHKHRLAAVGRRAGERPVIGGVGFRSHSTSAVPVCGWRGWCLARQLSSGTARPSRTVPATRVRRAADMGAADTSTDVAGRGLRRAHSALTSIRLRPRRPAHPRSVPVPVISAWSTEPDTDVAQVDRLPIIAVGWMGQRCCVHGLDEPHDLRGVDAPQVGVQALPRRPVAPVVEVRDLLVDALGRGIDRRRPLHCVHVVRHDRLRVDWRPGIPRNPAGVCAALRGATHRARPAASRPGGVTSTASGQPPGCTRAHAR